MLSAWMAGANPGKRRISTILTVQRKEWPNLARRRASTSHAMPLKSLSTIHKAKGLECWRIMNTYSRHEKLAKVKDKRQTVRSSPEHLIANLEIVGGVVAIMLSSVLILISLFDTLSTLNGLKLHLEGKALLNFMLLVAAGGAIGTILLLLGMHFFFRVCARLGTSAERAGTVGE